MVLVLSPASPPGVGEGAGGSASRVECDQRVSDVFRRRRTIRGFDPAGCTEARGGACMSGRPSLPRDRRTVVPILKRFMIVPSSGRNQKHGTSNARDGLALGL